MSKKDLHTLFQKKFENYEVTPPDFVWDNIEAKLKEKDKRKRFLPFWWTFSGVAAGFIIAFFCYPFLFEAKQQLPNQTPVVTNSNGTKAPNQPIGTTQNSSTSIVQSSKENTTNTVDHLNKNNKTIQQSKASMVKTADAIHSNASVAIVSNTKKAKQSRSKASIVSTSAEVYSNNSVAIVRKAKTARNKTSINLNFSNPNTIKSNSSLAINESENSSTAIISNNKKVATSNSNTTNPLKKYSKDFSDKNLRVFSEVNVVQHDKEFSATIKSDSAVTAKKVPNALEELLKEKEKKVVAVKKTDKWEVAPTVAPIFFNSFTNGSPLDPKLESNTKSYTTNYSYGVGVNYEVNKKFSIRSGLNTFSVDYTTNGITYYQSAVATAKMQHLSPNDQGATIQIDNTYVSTVPMNKLSVDKQEGSVNQKMGYVEMPVEMSYKLLNSKFGVNLIGGFSTLFLNQNSIYLNSNGSSTKIGEADNLNSIHFSTNVGLGLKYGVTNKVNLKMEPVFKYQINTFNSDSGGFKPYIFGIYTGVSYTF